MTYEQMTAAFSSVIRNALTQYENQTPVYYYLGYYGSWVFLILGVFSLIFALQNIKKGRLLVIPCCCLLLGYYSIQFPRHNLGVYYGYSLTMIAYPMSNTPDIFLDRADFSNPVCCSINEAEYLYAKRIGFQKYADSKAKALAELVAIERKSFLSDGNIPGHRQDSTKNPKSE